ncbi:MAG: hypothetical protein ACK55X_05450 [Synechococcaceae cyanobacterium]|jgi:hypothetical protein
MAKKSRSPFGEPSPACPRCSLLEDELARSEQRSYDRLREVSDLYAELQAQQRAEAEQREQALERLKALRELLREP